MAKLQGKAARLGSLLADTLPGGDTRPTRAGFTGIPKRQLRGRTPNVFPVASMCLDAAPIKGSLVPSLLRS